jgi:23S rRNA pseudouridine955/2504/2580 synthase
MSQPEKEAVARGVEFVTIDLDSSGQRLDNFLLRRFSNVPKSRIYRAVRGGEVRINKGRVAAKYKLCEGDLLRIPPLKVQVEEPPKRVANHWLTLIEQSVIFEDDDLLILNKPTGLAVHGGSGLNYGLIEVLRQLRPEAKRLELVHRLDRDTSGCIMIAKKSAALRHLHAALRERKITKRYQALVYGKWPRNRRQVDAPLKKFALGSGERIVRVNEEGQGSITEFSVLERFQNATLVEARPLTGRTHQIRVHASHIGHCLLGDDKYAHTEANALAAQLNLGRLFLHAESLEFMAPSGRRVKVAAPLDDALKRVLDLCGERA